MTAQTLFLVFAASLPLVTLVALGRGVLGLYRVFRARHWPLALLVTMAVLCMVLVFSAAAIVWFIAAVSHGARSPLGDLLVVVGSGAAVYAVAIATWAICRFAEPACIRHDKRSTPDPEGAA